MQLEFPSKIGRLRNGSAETHPVPGATMIRRCTERIYYLQTSPNLHVMVTLLRCLILYNCAGIKLHHERRIFPPKGTREFRPRGRQPSLAPSEGVSKRTYRSL
jgi:hypothetical protein